MRHIPLAAATALLTAASVDCGAQTAELPVPCVSGVCGANVPGFVTAGRATATATGNVMRVTQQTDRAILNWASFNVGPDGRVIFDQPSSSSIALNRIFQGSPSRILGAIEANGQIYLINQNGFMFGPTARVRTSGLMVSSLNMLDSTFENGLLSPELLQRGKAALESDGRVGVLDPQGNPVLGDDGQPLQVKISIEAGAKISTLAAGQRVMIASRTVDNAGTVEAPDGQVVLAAGEKVYLQASTDPALRGLLVEVDAGGEAWNRMTGSLSAARGNVTMVGLAVNQQGRASATTTVSTNGSVRLLARDSVNVLFDGNNNPYLTTKHGGSLELGAASVTEVLPEITDHTTAIDEQRQLPSSVELQGREVFLRGGSQVRATGGDIHIRALNDPTLNGHDPQARLRVESGAVVDASGGNASASVSRNVVRVELRGNELRDAPLQRDGVLRGKEVFVDARVGTPIADVSGAIAGIGRAIDERTAAGGNIVVESYGDVVVAPGALFDVSGGTLTYTPGTVQTTQLLTADGRAVDIGQARADQLYTGLINPTSKRSFDRWGVTEDVRGPLIGRYEEGYTEGRSAGSLQFLGPALALDGNFLGNVTVGVNQRDAAHAPAGGRFVVGTNVLPTAFLDYRAPSINFVVNATPTSITDDGSLPQRPLELNAQALANNGFTSFELYSNGVVSIPEAMTLVLAPGSSLRIAAPRIEARGNVTAAGGSIRLASVLSYAFDGIDLRGGIDIGPGATLDVRGLWNNELSLLTPIYRDGGEIDLAVRGLGGELIVGEGVTLLADGGASLSVTGTLIGGKGGRIGLRGGAGDGAIEIGSNVTLSAFGVAGARGGTFALEAPRVEVVAGREWSPSQRLDLHAHDPGYFQVGDSLFSDHGFANFDLLATGPRDESASLVVRSNANIDARASTRLLDGSAGTRSSGGTVEGFSQVALLPDYQRGATSVTLRAEPREFSGADKLGGLLIEGGARLSVDARGSVNLTSTGGISVDGTITARGGNVTAFVPTPTDLVDAGYRAELGISFLDDAVVDVSGITLLRPNDAGLLQGEVLAGGNVSLLADRGFVSTARGGTFDLRGGSHELDIVGASGAYVRRSIGSAGGSLTLRAPESLDFAAVLHAQGGAGDTHSPGGTATFQLTRQRGWAAGPPGLAATYPSTPRTLLVTADRSQVSGGQNGIGIVDAQWVRAAGLDTLNLEAGNRVEFYAGADLTLGRALQVAAPVIGLSGDRLALNAPWVSFGPTIDTSGVAVVPSVPGIGQLEVNAALVEFNGHSTLSGISQATFNASSELRLRGFENAGRSTGSLTLAGDLTLHTPVIYPTTRTEFAITASGGANDRVRFEYAGVGSDALPLSVGGSLTVNARSISQQGRVVAPFGRIALNASEDLVLAAGSVTSVSGGDATQLYGRVQLGTEWRYQLGPTDVSAQLSGGSVDLAGGNLRVDDGAVVDLSGGGDLYAYEWMPGTGGSKDALAPGVTSGLYAILPGLRDGFAPYDPQEFLGSDLKPGDSVYLSGAPGLQEGVYPLLPARYALLPGAMLVSAVPGTIDAVPGAASNLADGTPIVAGYRTYAGTDFRDARYSGFALRPGAYARSLATYQDSLASSFEPAARPLNPDNAARLALTAQRSLDLGGSVRTAAHDGGTGAAIDLSAPNLVLHGENESNVAGAVNVDAGILSDWKAASLLLGGRRSTDGRSVDVTADTVTVASDTRLAGTEIIAVARDELRLGSGAEMVAHGDDADGAPRFNEEASLLLTGDSAGAAVLGVSSSRALTVERGAMNSRAAIVAAADSRIASDGSLLIDAPRAVQVGAIDAPGAAWSLGSGEITFGETRGAEGLTLNASQLSAMNGAARLRLAADLMTFAESLSLGPLGELVLDAPQLRAAAPGINVQFTADSLTLLAHSSVHAGPLAPASDGLLSLQAGDFTLGPGAISVSGFGQTNLSAQREIVGTGVARLEVAGDLALRAGNIGAASDASVDISALGTLRTAAGAPLADASRLGRELGGRVALSARDIEHAGHLRVASGRLELTAANSLTLADSSTLDASGVMVSAAGRSLGSGGGDILLNSGGTLVAAPNALLDVSAAGDADAGGVSLRSAGQADVAADFRARAAAAARGGRFFADLDSLADFNALNDALEAGGFTERRAYTIGGDVTLAAGHAITAREVRLASGGLLTVAGYIDARSGNERGRIELEGNRGFTLASGAVLDARGLDASGVDGLGRGGSVLMSSQDGDVNLMGGSRIDVGGAQESGRVTIRAGATADGMRIGMLAAAVSGADVIALQPVQEFTLASQPVDADFSGIRDQVTAWAGVATPALLARFSTSSLPLAVRPGIDLLSDGDLALGSLELSSWRFGGEPAALAFRATGNIDIDGVISDGFELVTGSTGVHTDLMAGNSSSLLFEAGDSLRINAGTRVRTGTGDLTFRARNDIEFGEGASVYTGGVSGAPTRELTRGATYVLPTRGGRLELEAGHDVKGAVVTQAVGDWQVRQSRAVVTPASEPGWGTDLRTFGWNAGTLGGGDLTVRAGRDIRDLSAAAADSASLSNGSRDSYGGGVMQLDAGNDITSAYLHLTRGDNQLRAGGAIGLSREDDSVGEQVGSVFSIQEASLDLNARRGISFEGAFNPTVVTQLQTGAAFRSYFLSYAPDSHLRARSATGDVQLFGSRDRLKPYVGSATVGNNDSVQLTMLPPRVELRATDGDVLLSGDSTLAPADDGQLELFAARDIRRTSGFVAMSDVAAGALPTPVNQADNVAFLNEIARQSGASNRHANDDQPVLINAGRDVVGAIFILAKHTELASGRDVRNVTLINQNLRASDATLVSAGRDVIYDRDAGNSQIMVGGAGRLDVIAARDVDLGFSAGISTVGRLLNPALTSEKGADITVLAGAGAGDAFDIADFITDIVAPSEKYRVALQGFVTANGGAPAESFEAAVEEFRGLAANMQRAFVLPLFFGELVAAGREANTVKGSDFERGYAAIDALFPGSREPAPAARYDGDLKLAFSRIYTLADADISLLVPGGLLNVGLANPPPGLAGSRKPSELGIVAQRAGSVRVFAQDDVLVNQSRIFTLRGGDIAIWSTTGDIDAGRGAKSSISAPPPTILVDPTGRVTLDFAGAVAGSGIRGIITGDGLKPGDVDLIAPAGIVDAGDAGIGAAGNLNVAAQQVVGLDNIQAGGTSTGVPAETSSLGASLTGASSVASSANSAAGDKVAGGNATQAAAPLADSALGFLDVFLEGFGAEVCKPDDSECLKRNQK